MKLFKSSPQLSPVPVKLKRVSEPTKKPEHNVMEFLQQLSKDVKRLSPALPPSISDKIDHFVKEHGNRYPETTK